MREARTIGILAMAAAVATPVLAFNPQSTPASMAELFQYAPAPIEGVQQFCWQDQVGNQWDFTYDPAHRNMYGTVHVAQTCTATEWPMTGSYWGVGRYELTAANPEGDNDSCYTTAMVKGTYPKGAWYYETGYGEQGFTWVPCGVDVGVSRSPGGLIKSR